MKHEIHEAAEIWPLEEETINELAKDLKLHGQYMPIILYKGKILDGRRRYLACKRAKIQPEFKEVNTDDPIALSLSYNKHRRHSSSKQIAAAVLRATALYEQYAAEAKERQKEKSKEGGKLAGKGRPLGVPPRGGKPKPTPRHPTSDKKLGEALGVGERTVSRVRAVQAKGVPVLVEAMQKGTISPTKANEIAKLPKEKQKETLEKSLNGSKKKSVAAVETPNNKDWKYAYTVADECLEYVRKSRLARMRKDHPYRKEAFKIVINWLNHKLKEV